jgi:ApaG protein
MYSKTTHKIKVTALPQFVPEQSFPDDNLYVWIYTIIIENQSEDIVQLLSRYWHIVDSFGDVSEVRGKGVIGEQPLIKPGTFYEYTSSCQLKNNSGIMGGKYFFQNLNNQQFEVEIPAFSLDVPYDIYTLN